MFCVSFPKCLHIFIISRRIMPFSWFWTELNVCNVKQFWLYLNLMMIEGWWLLDQVYFSLTNARLVAFMYFPVMSTAWQCIFTVEPEDQESQSYLSQNKLLHTTTSYLWNDIKFKGCIGCCRCLIPNIIILCETAATRLLEGGYKKNSSSAVWFVYWVLKWVYSCS